VSLPSLTEPQKRVLAGIQAFWDKRHIPPTIRDIKRETGYRSTSTVHYHVTHLVALGVIERDLYVARSIRVIQPSERTPDAVPSTVPA